MCRKPLARTVLFHLLLRLPVGDRIVVDIVHRPADDDAVEALAELGFGARLQLADEAADDLRGRRGCAS